MLMLPFRRVSSFLVVHYVLLLIVVLEWSVHQALAMEPATTTRNDNNDKTSCRLVTLIPFTDTRQRPSASSDTNNDTAVATEYGNGNWPSAEALAWASISLLAVAEMARQHFVRTV